ncbi:MAG: trypsin-like serine peptidase, partial [Bacteroidota bacterium]
MKKLSLLSVIVLLCASQVLSQIQTKKTDEQAFQRLKIAGVKGVSKKIQIASVDIARLLEEDSKDPGPPRFGKGVNVNLGMKDGKWEDTAQGRVWSLTIESKKAYSLSAVIDNLTLAEGAELYILSMDKRVIFGPVTSQNYSAKEISTDIIPGSEMLIQLFEPADVKIKSRLHISRVVHGYRDVTNYIGFGDSAPCHVDINCTQGNAWQAESNAVALLILNGERFCSGTLLNNACQDFTPNLLTAFHCVDIGAGADFQNGVLSTAERNGVANWVFRFQYKSPTCGGNDATTYFSYSGATFRSAWATTDFALLLLNNRPTTGGIQYAGWSRSTAAPTSTVGIHHPRGDVMKISVDNNPSVSVAWPGTPANTHWRSTFDDGTVEHGSSGSALFDQNRRLVGQLHGNQNNSCLSADNNNCFCTQPRVGEYGRFDVSWNGGGTTDTQLSAWLTNDPNVMQTNTIPYLGISSSTSLVCSTAQLSIHNQPANTTISWTTNVPQGLSINGSGLATRLNNYDGIVTATGWVNGTGVCSSSHTPISAFLWVGKPVSSISGISNPYPGQLYTYNTIDPSLNGAASYNWVVQGGTIYGGGGPSSTSVTVYWFEPGFVELTSDNACGSSTYTLYVTPDQSGGCDPCQRKRTEEEISNDENPGKPFSDITAFPNPSSDVFTINIDDEAVLRT